MTNSLMERTEVRVDCQGNEHTIRYHGGRLTLLNHSKREVRRLTTYSHLVGGDCLPTCLVILHSWRQALRDRPGSLESIPYPLQECIHISRMRQLDRRRTPKVELIQPLHLSITRAGQWATRNRLLSRIFSTAIRRYFIKRVKVKSAVVEVYNVQLHRKFSEPLVYVVVNGTEKQTLRIGLTICDAACMYMPLDHRVPLIIGDNLVVSCEEVVPEIWEARTLCLSDFLADSFSRWVRPLGRARVEKINGKFTLTKQEGGTIHGYPKQ